MSAAQTECCRRRKCFTKKTILDWNVTIYLIFLTFFRWIKSEMAIRRTDFNWFQQKLFLFSSLFQLKNGHRLKHEWFFFPLLFKYNMTRFLNRIWFDLKPYWIVWQGWKICNTCNKILQNFSVFILTLDFAIHVRKTFWNDIIDTHLTFIQRLIGFQVEISFHFIVSPLCVCTVPYVR